MLEVAFACVLVADVCAVRALRAARRLPDPAAIVHRNAWYLSMPPLVLANALVIAVAFDNAPAVTCIAVLIGLLATPPSVFAFWIRLSPGPRNWSLRAVRLFAVAALCLAFGTFLDSLDPP